MTDMTTKATFLPCAGGCGGEHEEGTGQALVRALLPGLVADWREDVTIGLVCWIGIVRRKDDGTVRWPVSVDPWWLWKVYIRHGPRVQVFRNLPHVVKWQPGRLLPRRWGGQILGLEIGDRG